MSNIALYSVAFDLLLIYITSPMSLTWDMSNIAALLLSDIFVHNSLNIQRIFNPKKVLESCDLGLFSHNPMYIEDYYDLWCLWHK